MNSTSDPGFAVSIYEGGAAPPARTLIDIFAETVRRHPDAPAIDDGRIHTYRECVGQVLGAAEELRRLGVGAGDRVGIRMPSGGVELYLAILAVLAVGAAYVPVDADDPDERAEIVWTQADVVGVLTAGFRFLRRRARTGTPGSAGPFGPGLTDDAWVIFTSGSTGTPKGVAINHRSAAAFVDAEAELFCRDRPLGPGDRVLAGLSVAFDASCEEMWLAWRHGACLVPAPRALVRAGGELGPWLRERGITVVSTVPTLAALWPRGALERIRPLILGGEACPPELARRLTTSGCELWNTYGPTETTVAACAARLDGSEPVRIGLPLRGWLLAVVDTDGQPVAPGDTGELVIAGVGVGRYLDEAKDREKFVPVPALRCPRGYRSGDLVRADPQGLVFIGRADDQVKVGGRRIELGEIDAALLRLPGVTAAAAAVRSTDAGGGPIHQVLVGYVVVDPEHPVDQAAARARLTEVLPGSLVPRLVAVAALPVRTSGKVDRDALPWPPPDGEREPGGARDGGGPGLADSGGTLGWLAGLWEQLLAVPIDDDADFFALGGTSLATARLVAALRERYPEASVTDVYHHPRIGDLAARLRELDEDGSRRRRIHLTPRRAGLVQFLVIASLVAVRGVRWVLALAAAGDICTLLPSVPAVGPPVPWSVLVAGWLVLVSPIGRLLSVVAGVRLLRMGVEPGCYGRGGWAHLRLWASERVADAFGIASLAGTPLAAWYARLLGCEVGAGVDLRASPPVTGLASFGSGCVVESEVDLAGWWLDGDLLHVGTVEVQAGARVGARANLMPGAKVGVDAELAAGSCLYGEVPAGERWHGVPARHDGAAGAGWPERAAGPSRLWDLARTATLAVLALLPVVVAAPWVAAVYWLELRRVTSVWQTAGLVAVGAPVDALCSAVLLVVLVRLVGCALRPGVHPAGSAVGWAAWLVDRLVSSARVSFFPLYASLLTPSWFRVLGAKVGRGVEISTATGLPGMMRVEDGAFLADDTVVAPYELRGGWVRVGRSRVGNRAFVGNSGLVAPDRAVPDGSLVAVLSDAPEAAAPDSSWIGRPPFPLPRVSDPVDPARTFQPPRRLVAARAGVESLRLGPWMISAVLAWLTARALVQLEARAGWAVTAALAGPVLLVAGIVALAVTTAVKWALVGRFRAGEHPLWSSFVWRNELFDVFYEQLAMPWLGSTLLGTPMFNSWLRTLGARIGSGVWCESHWLPETDLVRLADGVTINRGCVLQTHLFHDRLMRVDAIDLGPGATLGPHSIALPGVCIGGGATIGGGSLVMRGEAVPPTGRWLGNPISAWPEALDVYPEHAAGQARHLLVRTPRRRAGAAPGIAAMVAAVAGVAIAVPTVLGGLSQFGRSEIRSQVFAASGIPPSAQLGRVHRLRVHGLTSRSRTERLVPPVTASSGRGHRAGRPRSRTSASTARRTAGSTSSAEGY